MENSNLSKYSTERLAEKLVCMYSDGNTEGPLFKSYLEEVKHRLNKEA